MFKTHIIFFIDKWLGSWQMKLACRKKDVDAVREKLLQQNVNYKYHEFNTNNKVNLIYRAGQFMTATYSFNLFNA